MQNDLFDWSIRAQINLHPFFSIGLRHNRTVIAILRTLWRELGFRFQVDDLFLQSCQWFPGFCANLCLKLVQVRLRRLPKRHQFGSTFFNLRVCVVRTLSAVDGSKDALQTVIMLLRERIELVIVTSRTLNRDAAKSVQGSGHHVITIKVASDLTIVFCFRNFHVTDEIPGAGSDESQSQNTIGLIREQSIACQLFLHESRVRFVLVE